MPDSSGDIPLLKLVKGQYTSETMLYLLEMLLQWHCEYAGAAAVFTDVHGHTAMQAAVHANLSLPCLKAVCDFAIAQIRPLMALVHANVPHGPCCVVTHGMVFSNTASMTYFDTDGSMLNVVGLFVTILTTYADFDPTTFYAKKQIVVTFEEARKCARDIAKWVVPRNCTTHFHNAILARMLKMLQATFLALPRLLQPDEEYERSRQQEQCVRLFPTECAPGASEAEAELLAWIEAEKGIHGENMPTATKLAKLKRPPKNHAQNTTSARNRGILATQWCEHVPRATAMQTTEIPCRVNVSEFGSGVQWAARQQRILDLYRQHTRKHTAPPPPRAHPMFAFAGSLATSYLGDGIFSAEAVAFPQHTVHTPTPLPNLDLHGEGRHTTPGTDHRTKKNAWTDQKFIQHLENIAQVIPQKPKPSLILSALTNNVDLEYDHHVCMLCLVNTRNVMSLPSKCVLYCDTCVAANQAPRSHIPYQCAVCKHIILCTQKLDVQHLV